MPSSYENAWHRSVSADYLSEAISVHQRLQLQSLLLLGEARVAEA